MTRRVGTKQNDNFYFLSFSDFSNLFWPEIRPYWYFLIFCYFFGILYYASGGIKTNDNFYFLSFSAFSNLFWLEMKRHRYFLIFWLFYWNFLLRVGLERNGTITFIFLLSLPFPTYFGLK